MTQGVEIKVKDSGFEAVKTIPIEWSVRRIKYILKERNERVEDADPSELLSVSEYYGVAPRAEKIKTEGTFMRAESLEGYKICKQNDMVINIMLAWKGALGVSDYNGVVSPSYCVYSPVCNDIEMKYLHYLFTTDAYKSYFRRHSTGIIESRLRLYSNELYSLWGILPPLPEQHAIATYLDDRCSKLDEIIAEAKESIEEYKELKQAVIFEAVTKGLDKNVPMKQSNVAWIETVPFPWQVGKLRLLADFYNGDRSSRYPSGDDIQSEGIIFITSNNLGNIRLNTDISTNKYITQEKYNELGGAKLKLNDIVFCLRGSVGKCSINKTFIEGTIASSLVVIRPKKINPDYLNYVLQTSRITDEAIVSAIGIGSANLAAHDISEFFVPLPTDAEQREIVNYLDVRIGNLDALISEKQSLIEDLQAYKKSLIYEVVTGKRRVV